MIRWIKMVALALVAGLAGACAAGSAPERQVPVDTPATAPVPGSHTAIPPIDAAAPATTETATFALG